MTHTTTPRAEEGRRDEDIDSRPSSIRTLTDWMARRRWAISVMFLYAFTVILSRMDRYFTWDEAVFWSQSGGVDGASTGPLHLVASRELGSSFLIRVLRFVEDDIPEVRFLWATLAFFLLVLGARRLIRHIGDRGALFFLWVYGSHWLVLAWTPSFYSNVFAAGFALLAATLYLDMISTTSNTGYWTAALFGLSIAATFFMRPFEATLVVGGLATHLLAFNWSMVRSLVPKAVTSAAVALVAFGIPWVSDSINRFGSVTERISAGFSQQGQVASGLRSNIVGYLGALSGDRVESLAGGPYWPRYIIFGLAAAAAVVIVVALARKGVSAVRGPAGLFILLSAANASFFLFWREAVNERYFFITMIFAAALFGWALSTNLPRHPGWPALWTLAGLGVIWLATQVVIVTAYESTRDLSAEGSARVAATMRTLSNDNPCEVMSRYGTPQLQVASGCRARLYTEWSDASVFARDNADGVPKFIYGPASEGHFQDLPTGWVVVPVEGFRFAYRVPEYQDSAG